MLKNKIFWWGIANWIFYIGFIIINYIKNTLDDTETLPKNPMMIIALLFLFTALSLCYALTFIYNKNKIIDIKLIIFFSLLFSFTLLIIYPLGSADIFGTILRARIADIYHYNPYLYPPRLFSADLFSSFAAWQNVPSHYGPLWTSITIAISSISKNNFYISILLNKLIIAIFFFGSLPLAHKIIKRLNLPDSLFLLFAWNPLILFTTMGDGHNDAAMMFFALLAIWLAINDKKYFSIFSIIIAFLIKYIAILMLPFLLIYLGRTKAEKIKFAGASVFIFLILAIVAYAPFWQGIDTFKGIYMVQNNFFIDSLPYAIYAIILKIFYLPLIVFKMIFWFIFLTIYGFFFKKFWQEATPRKLIHYCALTMLVFLLLIGNEFFPWFLLWFLMLAIFSEEKKMHQTVLIVTIIGFLSYTIPISILLLVTGACIFITQAVLDWSDNKQKIIAS